MTADQHDVRAGAALHCAVVGDPVAHSLSPALHRAAHALLGIDGRYDAVRVPAGSLASYAAGLGEEWRGLSVTAPLKREALALADDVTPTARSAGGVNTLVRTAGGWLGDNTDLPGAVAAIRERYDGPVTAATLLGAGATAASTGLALTRLGARSLRLLARDPARAEETADALRGAAEVRVERLDARPTAAAAAPEIGEVVVSTVPADAQDPALIEAVAGAAVVFEVVYDPWPTPFAAAAAERGQVVVSGLDLLVHQAVLQVHAFAGLDPDPRRDADLVAAMRAAGEAALAERSVR